MNSRNFSSHVEESYDLCFQLVDAACVSMGMEECETMQGFPFAWKVRIFTSCREIRTFCVLHFVVRVFFIFGYSHGCVAMPYFSVFSVSIVWNLERRQVKWYFGTNWLFVCLNLIDL